MRTLPGVNGAIPGQIPLQGQVPLLGRPQGPSKEQQVQMQVMQGVHQIATAIFEKLAISYIESVDWMQDLDRERLRQLARDSRSAAQAYFEGLGIASFEQNP